MQDIEFWYSIGSTYSYMTVMRLPGLARARGATVRWRPFDVRAIMTEIGNSPFIGKPVKAAHMWRDMERRAPRHGLAPRLPAPYPLTDLPFVNSVAVLGMDEGWGETFTRAAYRRWFEEGLWPDRGTGLELSLREAGQDPERVITAAGSTAATARLAQETDAARKRGIFGSPSFVVGDELFWGDDRLEDALDWARDGRLG